MFLCLVSQSCDWLTDFLLLELQGDVAEERCKTKLTFFWLLSSYGSKWQKKKKKVSTYYIM